MVNFIVYDIDTGEILRTGYCPRDMLPLQAGENEWVMEGVANERRHKVVNHTLVAKRQSEIDDKLFQEREHTFPPDLDLTLPDEQLNEQINNYFLGRMDVARWRLKNYERLRRMAYPPLMDYVDAQVKISMAGPEAAEGHTQVVDYVTACRKVKERFPKE